MINSIVELKDFGIFRDFTKSRDLKTFGQYNLFYGWNGSGKTTLSKLFACLEKKIPSKDFQGSAFKIELQDCTIDNSCFTSNDLNMFVFNRDFVDENINWNDTLKSILLISEEKIEEQKSLIDLKVKEKALLDESVTLSESKGQKEEAIDKFLSSTAKNTKQKFQILDTADTYYFNYDKAKLKKLIDNYSDNIKSGNAILCADELSNVTESAKPTSKDRIGRSIELVDYQLFQQIQVWLSGMVAQSVLSKTIDKLKDNQIISHWVEEGLKLHKKLGARECEFCGNSISDQRFLDLENHFSDVMEKIKKTVIAEQESLQGKLISELKLSHSALYHEFQKEFQEAMIELDKVRLSINRHIGQWMEALDAKCDNPFRIDLKLEDMPEDLIGSYNEQLLGIDSLISKHNSKTDNFTAEVKMQKEKLELHYASDAVKEFDYFRKLADIASLKEKLSRAAKEITDLNQQISTIEKLLSNEALGAAKFNRQLHKFLGHQELSLSFDQKVGGYRIVRGSAQDRARNLSEGEKTAIAFVYFITKLKENGNEIKKSIVVIDDPVSSFDSNHLFNSYSFLKSECEHAQQLFILTHNFIFFRLIRDWLSRKNKRKKREDGSFEETIKSQFFSIEVIPAETRTAELRNAHQTLLDYNSEYHFLFSQLNKYQSRETLSLNEAFIVANLARKLLESFLSFKFPKHRNDFHALIETAVSDKVMREKVYRFINKYSHAAQIDIYDPSIESLLGEGGFIGRQI